MAEYTEADLHVKNALRLEKEHEKQDKLKEAMPKIKAEIDNIYGGLQYINKKANSKAITTHDHSSSEENPVSKISNNLITPIADGSLKVDGKEIVTDANLAAKISNSNYANVKYRREADGFTIQWGTIDTGGEGSYHVTFFKPFNKIFSIQVTKDDTGADARWDTWPEKRNVTADVDGLFHGFDIWINWSGQNNNSGFVDWIAFGYREQE